MEPDESVGVLLDDLKELEFRSILVAALYQISANSADSSLEEAAKRFEQYLDAIQDNDDISILGTFQELTYDEALRNYYATR